MSRHFLSDSAEDCVPGGGAGQWRHGGQGGGPGEADQGGGDAGGHPAARTRGRSPEAGLQDNLG